MRKPRFIITTHNFRRHETATDAIAERNRLRERHPDKDFRVLTVIDEPTEDKLARDSHLRATDLRPDDPFNGQCSIDEVSRKYRA